MKYYRTIVLLAALSQFINASANAEQSLSRIATTVPIVSPDLAFAPGEVELKITLNRFGYVTGAEVLRSSNFQLNAPCLAAIRQWRYSNPSADGAVFVQPFQFGDGIVDTTPIAATRPKPRNKVAPTLSEAIATVSGEVTVALAIETDGHVSSVTVVKSSNEALDAACLAAAKQWTFKPATENGHAITSNAYLPFQFIGTPAEAKATTAKAELVDNTKLVAIRQDAPQLPANLAQVDGTASIAFTVNPYGYVIDATVVSASNADLGELARSAVLFWQFKPVVKNGVAIDVKAVQPMIFGNGSFSVAAVDKLPSVRDAVSPSLPAELTGVSGVAHAIFDIDENGNVSDVTIADSSHEEFKAAILAVAKDWKFNPARRAGVATPARVEVPFVFGPKYASL